MAKTKQSSLEKRVARLETQMERIMPVIDRHTPLGPCRNEPSGPDPKEVKRIFDQIKGAIKE